MPGRLLGFINHHRGSFSSSDVKHPLKDVTSRSSSSSSLKAEIHEDRKRSMDHIKIPGLTKHHSDKKSSGHSSSPNADALRPAKLDLVVESPPLVSYNSPANSSGALFSAQLRVDVTAKDVVLDSFELQLVCTVTIKKPVSQHCPECTTQTTELKKWVFAKEPLHLQRGEHRFPFSYLFPGHLPATTRSNLAQLEYHLSAVAKTSAGETLKFGRQVNLARSILPGNEKHSVRIFPPTNLTASVTLNPVVHPIGDFPVHLRLAGITTKQNDAQVRWRVRKMNWRIEEHQRMVSPACSKHTQKVGGVGKGVMHEDTRIIGDAEISYHRTPWKTDFDAGEVECEFNAVVNPVLKPVCDVEAPNGLSVSHTLVIEMVVAEEWAPNKKPHQVTPTGAARILRMSFHLTMTERAGLGISWDEEIPPVYEDVPASPPAYQHMEDFDLAELEGSFEDFHLDDPHRQGSASSSRGVGSRPSTATAESSRASQSPRLSAQSPRLSVAMGTSTSEVRSTSGSRNRATRFSADDLLSEPNLPVRQSIDESHEPEDRRVGSVS
jgi:arrestin-related trafficking adapter 1